MTELTMVSLEVEPHWPEWFSLDYSPSDDHTSTPFLLIGFNRFALGNFIANPPPMRYINILREELVKCEADAVFSSDPGKVWGFGEVIKPYQQAVTPGDSLTWYHVPIPQVEKETGKKCKACKGKVRDVETGMDCLFCDRSGKETIMDWKGVHHVCATLSFLSLLFSHPQKTWVENIHTRRYQLLSLEVFFREGCAPLRAVLSEDFGNFLRSRSQTILPHVKEALKTAYLQMVPSYARFDDFHFKAHIYDGGQLILDVPGSACGLYVDGFDESLRSCTGPMKLSDHNVDSGIQQLSLVCGLASLTGIVRKSKQKQ